MPETHRQPAKTTPPVHRGYIEGYYGQLLDWQERAGLIDHLGYLDFDSYLYAPKEDIYHRWQWRTPYPPEFLAHFREFAKHAKSAGIYLMAGIAPGLDFDFTHPDNDKNALVAKAEQLVQAGADAIVLMFDDISDDISMLAEAGLSEGECHASLATEVQTHIGCSVMLVPRLYSDEISGDHAAYADALNRTLDPDITVMICGETIVGKEVNLQGKAGILGNSLSHPRLIWDNLYCNDYCPRRLFLGPYQGRNSEDPILLNGTGLYQTDRLLLSLMTGAEPQQILNNAGVPKAIEKLLGFFHLPVFSNQPLTRLDNGDIPACLEAIEILLWQWKSPLAREWYPYLFGLKQDLLLLQGDMPDERLAKTQSSALFSFITKDRI